MKLFQNKNKYRNPTASTNWKMIPLDARIGTGRKPKTFTRHFYPAK